MTNLDSILKSRDITLPAKVHIVKAMFFPAIMYGYESWTMKNADRWRIDAFELCVREDSWESLGDQTSQYKRKSILNIHWRDWCWGWSSNTLATGCEELTHWKRPWCWERLRKRGPRRMRWLDGIINGHEFEQTPGDSEGQGSLACCSIWGPKELDLVTEKQQQ